MVMADLTKSADALISEVTATVKRELLSELLPITQRIAAASAELEKALSGKRGGARRGRKPGPKPGSKRKKKGAAKAAAPAKAKRGRPRKAKRNPRGALQECIRKALGGAKGGLTFAGIRDEVLKAPMFMGRNGKTLYTQIVQAVGKMTEVKKGANKKYLLKKGMK